MYGVHRFLHQFLKKDLILRHKVILAEGRCCLIHRFNVTEDKGNYKATKRAYRIMFHYGTKVKVCDGTLPTFSFNFVPFDVIHFEKYPNSHLVGNVTLLLFSYI